MGRQRHRHQMKEKEISPDEELEESEASNLSHIEFRVRITRILNNMKKDIKNIFLKKTSQKIKNAISEINNTLQRINSRLGEVED